tara:strand:+ start:16088 stop:17596 length:1509 start_codon:yes stop_codon:yes gene_type:complete
MKKFSNIREERQLDEYGANEWNVYVKVGSKRAWKELENAMASLDSWIESHWDIAKKMAKFTFNQDKHTGSERRKAGAFIKKIKGVEFSHAVKEDVPANNASSGSVAGLGSEPPVSKAAQKKKKKMARRSMPMGEAVIKSMDSKVALNVYNKLKKGSKVTVEFGGAMSSTKEPLELVVSSPHRVVGKSKVGRIILKNPNNMRGMKYTLYNRNGNITLAQGDMATILKDLKVVKESVELDEALSSREAKDLENGVYNAVMDMLHQDAMHTDLDLGDKDVKKAVTKATQRVAKDISRMKSESVELDEKPYFDMNKKRKFIVPDKTGKGKLSHKTSFYKAKDALVAAGIPNMGEKNTTPPKLKVHPKFKKQAQKIMKKYKGVDLEINHRMPERPLPNFKEEVVNECWDTHVQKGYKMKGGKRVPNCVPKNQVSEGTFAGCQVFKVSSEEYSKCTHPRTKNERWKKKLNMEMRDEIRTYAHRNPGKPVIVQDETSGMMSYLILKKDD